MSFRLFIYYCAVCGAWAGLVGWLVGRYLAPTAVDETAGQTYLRAVLRGLCLGTTVALALGLVDGLMNTRGRFMTTIGRGLFVTLVGMVSGLIGGAVGQGLYQLTGFDALIVFGWLVTGLLIGASVGAYDIVARLLRKEDLSGAMKKSVNGLIGGGVGGLLGGVLYLGIGRAFAGLLGDADRSQDLYSPSAWGFVVLGGCIGLLIGLAQIILKEAWLKVEEGFRPGRELILTKEQTVIGRAEGCDLGLFGDAAIAKEHARIVLRGQRYLLELMEPTAEAFVNDQPVTTAAPLRSGDRIRVGKNLLRFGERQKRK